MRAAALALVLAALHAAAAAAPTPVACGETILKPGEYTLKASCTCKGNGPCIKVSGASGMACREPGRSR
jgi:hypothetical protein